MSDCADMSFPDKLREIADALDEDRVTDKCLFIARLPSGEIISEDSGLTVFEAAMMSRDFVLSLRDMRDTWKLRNKRQMLGHQRRRQKRLEV